MVVPYPSLLVAGPEPAAGVPPPPSSPGLARRPPAPAFVSQGCLWRCVPTRSPRAFSTLRGRRRSGAGRSPRHTGGEGPWAAPPPWSPLSGVPGGSPGICRSRFAGAMGGFVRTESGLSRCWSLLNPPYCGGGVTVSAKIPPPQICKGVKNLMKCLGSSAFLFGKGKTLVLTWS